MGSFFFSVLTLNRLLTKFDLKYNSPLVDSVPLVHDGWTPPTMQSYIHFVVYI